jgi:hypothetical protein
LPVIFPAVCPSTAPAVLLSHTFSAMPRLICSLYYWGGGVLCLIFAGTLPARRRPQKASERPRVEALAASAPPHAGPLEGGHTHRIPRAGQGLLQSVMTTLVMTTSVRAPLQSILYSHARRKAGGPWQAYWPLDSGVSGRAALEAVTTLCGAWCSAARSPR